MLNVKKPAAAAAAPPPADAEPTAAVLADTVRKLDADISAAQGEFETLTGEREAKALKGGALLREHARRMVEQQEVVDALQAARAANGERLAKARQREAAAALEADIVATHAEHLGAYEGAWKALYDAMQAVAAAAEQLGKHETALQQANWKARHGNRLDLGVKLTTIQQRAAAELAPATVPERLTVKPARHAGESAEAHALRAGNWQAQNTDWSYQHEPFRVLGRKVVGEVQRLAIDHPDKRAQLRMRSGERLEPARPLRPPVETNATPTDAAPVPRGTAYHRYEFGGL